MNDQVHAATKLLDESDSVNTAAPPASLMQTAQSRTC